MVALPSRASRRPREGNSLSVSARDATQSETATAWIFKAAPDHWRLDEFLRLTSVGSNFLWYFPRSPELLSEGTRVYIWDANSRKPGVVALARTTGPVRDCEDPGDSYWTEAGRERLGGVRPRVPLRLEHVMQRPLTKVQIQHNSDLKAALANLSVNRWFAQQTNFPVQPDEERVLEQACLGRA
jgi:hypothetical protein